MKAIVHIGTEKTGSTSIQEYLYKNRKTLRKFGFYFVQSAGKTNNRALPAYCLNDDKFDDYFRAHDITTLAQKKQFQHEFRSAFEKEIRSIPKGVHTVIMSSEHFHSRTNTPEEVHKLHELLSAFFSNFTVICYLRDQVETCTSYYSTAIKSGHRPSFAKFLRNCNTKNLYYNYSAMLSNWENAFGRDSMDVSVFSPHEFLNKDLLDDFTAKLDPALVGELDKNILVENESLSYAGQVLGIAINGVFSAAAQNSDAIALRDRCHKIIYDNCKGRGEQPSLDERQRIHDEFAESNEQVRKRFLPEKPVLFPSALKQAETGKSIDAGFIDALSGVLDIIVEGRESAAFAGNDKIRLPDSYANILRNAALKLEKRDLKLAFELMNLAHEVRPSGPFIKRKLDEYRQKLN